MSVTIKMPTVAQAKTIDEAASAGTGALKDWVSTSKDAAEAINDTDKIAKLTSAIGLLSKASAAFAGVGAVLSLVKVFLPSSTSIILKAISKLSTQMAAFQTHVDTELQQLRLAITDALTTIAIEQHCDNIKTAYDSYNTLVSNLNDNKPDTTISMSVDSFMNVSGNLLDDLKSIAENIGGKDLYEGPTSKLTSTYTNSNGDVQKIRDLAKYIVGIMSIGHDMVMMNLIFKEGGGNILDSLKTEKGITTIQEAMKMANIKTLASKGDKNKIKANILSLVQSAKDATTQVDTYRANVVKAFSDTIVKCQNDWISNSRNCINNQAADCKAMDPSQVCAYLKGKLAGTYPFIDWVIITYTEGLDGDDILHKSDGYTNPQNHSAIFDFHSGINQFGIRMQVWGYLRYLPLQLPLVATEQTNIAVDYFVGHNSKSALEQFVCTFLGALTCFQWYYSNKPALYGSMFGNPDTLLKSLKAKVKDEDWKGALPIISQVNTELGIPIHLWVSHTEIDIQGVSMSQVYYTVHDWFQYSGSNFNWFVATNGSTKLPERVVFHNLHELPDAYEDTQGRIPSNLHSSWHEWKDDMVLSMPFHG